jgi:hypothetical protein
VSPAVLLVLALAQPAANPPAAVQASSDEQVERLSTGVVELWTRIGRQFFGSVEGQAFFRDSGPFRGCDAYNALRKEVSKRHYPAFRAEMLNVYREVVPAPALASARWGPLSAELFPYNGLLGEALDRRTSALVGTARAELAANLQEWLRSEGLEGARLGVGPRGDFWHGGNYAIIGLVCATPNNEQRRQTIGWQGVN